MACANPHKKNRDVTKMKGTMYCLLTNVFFVFTIIGECSIEVLFTIKKARKTFRLSRFSTQSRDRTGMEVNPLVFETSASTNSAIWAL